MSEDVPTASLTPLAQQYLDQTRPWVRFMSVMTFVGAGLMVLIALALMAATLIGGVAAGNARGLPGLLGGGLVGGFYLLLACVYIPPALYLGRYASAIARLKIGGTSDELEQALKHQKSFWRFAGIVTVISIVLGVVVLGLSVVVGIVAAMRARG